MVCATLAYIIVKFIWCFNYLTFCFSHITAFICCLFLETLSALSGKNWGILFIYKIHNFKWTSEYSFTVNSHRKLHKWHQVQNTHTHIYIFITKIVWVILVNTDAFDAQAKKVYYNFCYSALWLLCIWQLKYLKALLPSNMYRLHTCCYTTQ